MGYGCWSRLFPRENRVVAETLSDPVPILGSEFDSVYVSIKSIDSSPLKTYYEANTGRMSADVHGLFKVVFTHGALTRVQRIFKPMSIEEAQDLCAVFPYLKEVITVTFTSNNIGKRNLEILMPGLERIPLLHRLVISQNNLQDEGAKVLSKGISKIPLLEELVLDENQIGNRGARSLAKAIPQCSTLRLLDVRNNLIENSGVQSLIDAAMTCKCMTELNVANNRADVSLLRLQLLTFNLNS